jgi:stearoyl-CoA desaturase (delta-9 desaturase)
LHSPVNDGIIKTLLGRWEFHTLEWFMSKKTVIVRDWVKDPTCRWIDKQFYRIWFALIILAMMIDWQIAFYLILMPAFIYHVELNIFVNTVGHTWGYRNFHTSDRSQNNKWVSWWTLGEGLHNNHHANSRLYDFAVAPGEFDPSGWFIDRFMINDPQQRETGVYKLPQQ